MRGRRVWSGKAGRAALFLGANAQYQTGRLGLRKGGMASSAAGRPARSTRGAPGRIRGCRVRHRQGVPAPARLSVAFVGSDEHYPAGAFLSPDTAQRARASDLDPRSYLEANDSFNFFRQLGDLLTTGPTRTNVNDFRAILVT